MPTWTTPKTWQDNDLVTAALMNTHLRDNLDWLKAPNMGLVTVPGTSMTTNSTTFVAVANLNTITLTTTGNRVMLYFSGAWHNNTGAMHYLTFGVDGVAVGPTSGLYGHNTGAIYHGVSATFLTDVLTAGPHTFSVMWKVGAASLATMLVNCGVFWAREV